MFPGLFVFLTAAVLPALSLKNCAFDEWRNGYGSDGYFPCAEIGTAKNCSGRLLLVSINDGKADLSSVSTSRGRMNYDNQFVSGFVRPGCRLRLWSEKAFNGDIYDPGVDNFFEVQGASDFSSFKCDCPVSDKDVLSCVPQFEWVQVLKCENTGPTPTQCGFNAISAVQGTNSSEVDVQRKKALYDVARWYSANPRYGPTDENEWYEYTVKPNEVLQIEQQTARCGDRTVLLRIYNVTIHSTSDELISQWLWTPPEMLEGMSTTDPNKPVTTTAMATTIELTTSTAATTTETTTVFLTTTTEPTTTEEPTIPTDPKTESTTSELRTTEAATSSSTSIVQETTEIPTNTEILDETSTAIPLLEEDGFWRRRDSLAVVFSTVFALLSLTSLLLALAVWRYKRSKRVGRYDVETVRFTKSVGRAEVLRKPTPIPGVIKHEPHEKHT